MFHVIAAAADSAEELRSLGLCEAASAREALVGCLAQLDEDPMANREAGTARPGPGRSATPRATAAARRARRADASFIVTSVVADAHFVRDHDGVVKRASEVGRMRREFGVDVV